MAACQSGWGAVPHRTGYDNKGMTTGMTTRCDNKVWQHGVQQPRMSDDQYSTCQMLCPGFEGGDWHIRRHLAKQRKKQEQSFAANAPTSTKLAKPTRSPNRRPGYDNDMTTGMTMVWQRHTVNIRIQGWHTLWSTCTPSFSSADLYVGCAMAPWGAVQLERLCADACVCQGNTNLISLILQWIALFLQWTSIKTIPIPLILHWITLILQWIA